MRRIRLIVQYDGTAYAGWQRQANAMTVQQRIEENLQKITGEAIGIQGSGRTDSGVHALGQVAHFDTEARMPADKFAYALNAGLPPDIRILQSEEVSADFHARFSAKKKHYRYTIDNGAHASALYYRTRLHVHAALDYGAMAQGARLLAGTHDFSAYKAVECKLENTVRTLYCSEMNREGSLLFYDVVGSGFLYNMVRIIVGTLLEVGKGKRPASDMEAVLLSGARSRAGATAPAQGLTLVSVDYPNRE